ncbi:DUF4139 domain-containing protein [Treponema socranskii subsp. buccale]|uniref:DUF4139 domain-containing protein n=1 Tax=Treponema socranskii TaxID=53419 RepID=UPI0020A4B4E2|nr:DUF4139 domain-containing protein [Treponema socranskii]UTD03511.1 DUF4139 domain-containing protein [Treponema socranskii subsp. buccale]
MYKDTTVPLKNVTLYSSGVAYYEHEGEASGASRIGLSFTPEQINDVLKSLIVSDSAAKNISVAYQSEDALRKILESLSVNLSEVSDLADILYAQRGAEIEVATGEKAAEKIVGKILTVDRCERESGGDTLSLLASDGVHIIPFKEIKSFRFTDPKRGEDLNTALSVLLRSSSASKKNLSILIDAAGKRDVRLAYVMESPVWKPTYRIDAGSGTAEFQAWAIVDNSTDIDWNAVRLTLTTGRPVGFKQNLYPPYFTYRPTLPLMAGAAAAAETYTSAYGEADETYAEASSPRMMMSMNKVAAEAKMGSSYDDYDGSFRDTVNRNVAASDTSAEMFTFTPVKPVTIGRQESVMIPIAAVKLPAEKFSVFSNMRLRENTHPKFCVRIENTSGMKFPAGPVSVSSEGAYAGDAVLEFLPAGDTRIIGYGDDMEVNGSLTKKSSASIDTVKIAGGLLRTTKKRVYDSTYTVKNSAAKSRKVLIEHPITGNAALVATKALLEKTPALYRFTLSVDKNATGTLTVSESEIVETTAALIKMNANDFIACSSDADMPKEVRKAFENIAAKKAKLDEAKSAYEKLSADCKNTDDEQRRARENLEATGSSTAQGKQFLDKLMRLESELDSLKTKTEGARANLDKAEKDFSDYLKTVKAG